MFILEIYIFQNFFLTLVSFHFAICSLPREPDTPKTNKIWDSVELLQHSPQKNMQYSANIKQGIYGKNTVFAMTLQKVPDFLKELVITDIF